MREPRNMEGNSVRPPGSSQEKDVDVPDVPVSPVLTVDPWCEECGAPLDDEAGERGEAGERFCSACCCEDCLGRVE